MLRHCKWTYILYVALLLTSCYSHVLGLEPFQKKDKNQLRIVTYNVNWGESNFPITAPQKTSNAIRRINGDVVVLQEATPFWQAYFKKYLSDIYPYQLFKHQEDGGGLALLSKYSVNNQEYTHSSVGWHPGWIFEVNSPYGVLQIANLHLSPPLVSKANLHFSLGPYFETPAIREKEINYYYQFIQPQRPTIIAGDFNEDDNGFVTQFLNQHGFTDVQLKKGRNYSTWHWTFGFFTVQKKLDHIFYDHSFKETKAQVLYDGDSDHYPLAADLKLIR